MQALGEVVDSCFCLGIWCLELWYSFFSACPHLPALSLRAHAPVALPIQPQCMGAIALWSAASGLRKAQVGWLVDGCYNSNPQGGLRNPVYDIVPRLQCYDTSICRTLADFKDECCPTPTYCCPNSLRTCPANVTYSMQHQPKCRISGGAG